jgi:UPF0271 protein
VKLSIDLNADLGEGALGERELLELVSSASIACGFHAGDPAMMSASIITARNAGVAVGAHPSLADRENFGRQELPVTPDEVFILVAYQVGAFNGLARSFGVRPNHVKPHGALYNMAVNDRALANAIARAVVAFDRSLILFVLPGSELMRAGQECGLHTASEGFADRAYETDGSLTPRSRAGAVIHETRAVVQRVVRMAVEGTVLATDGSELAMRVDTICTHGDTPGAQDLVRALRDGLERAGVAIVPVAGPPA